MATLLFRRKKLVLSSDTAGVLRETVGTEYFTTNWAYELSVGSAI